MTISQPSDISGLTTDIDPHAEAYQDTGGTTPAGDGDVCRLLPDQVGGGWDFSQGTAGRETTLDADANTWLRAVADGVDDGFVSSNNVDLPSASICWVGEILGSAANAQQVIFSSSTFTNGIVLLFNYTLGRFEFYVNGNQVNSAGGLTTGAGNRFCVVAVYDGSNLNLYVNGTAATPVAETGVLTATGLLGLMNRNTASRPLNGTLYRFLVWGATAITSGNATDLNSYFSTLYASPPGGGSFVDNTSPILRHVMGGF